MFTKIENNALICTVSPNDGYTMSPMDICLNLFNVRMLRKSKGHWLMVNSKLLNIDTHEMCIESGSAQFLLLEMG